MRTPTELADRLETLAASLALGHKLPIQSIAAEMRSLDAQPQPVNAELLEARRIINYVPDRDMWGFDYLLRCAQDMARSLISRAESAEKAPAPVNVHLSWDALATIVSGESAREITPAPVNAQMLDALRAAHMDFSELRQSSDLSDEINFAMGKIETAIKAVESAPAQPDVKGLVDALRDIHQTVHSECFSSSAKITKIGQVVDFSLAAF